jgi:hypothetical protein
LQKKQPGADERDKNHVAGRPRHATAQQGRIAERRKTEREDERRVRAERKAFALI